MGSSIGNELNAIANATVRRAIAASATASRAGGSDPASTRKASFIDSLRAQLTASSAADAQQSTPGHAARSDVASFAPNVPESVDALWQQAQTRSLADGFGPGDEMLKALDARDEQAAAARRARGSSTSTHRGSDIASLLGD